MYLTVFLHFMFCSIEFSRVFLFCFLNHTILFYLLTIALQYSFGLVQYFFKSVIYKKHKTVQTLSQTREFSLHEEYSLKSLSLLKNRM
jgi:hypothetical protein